MKKQLFIVFLVCLLSLCVLAEDSSFYYKKGSYINLKIPCIDNNTICGISTACNISITYPNGSSYVSNAIMDNQGAYYNYTLDDTSIVGDYPSIVYCKSGVLNGYTNFVFTINNNGVKENNTSWITLIMMGIFMFISIILTIFFYHNESGLKYLFLILSFIFGTLLSYIGYSFPSEVTQSMSNILYVVFFVMMILTVLVIFIVLLELTIMAINRLTFNKEQEWERFT